MEIHIAIPEAGSSNLMSRLWKALNHRKLAIVLGGIVLGQASLYGPSLIGSKILLPLAILTLPGFYSPTTAEPGAKPEFNRELLDLVLSMEPSRHYLGSELRSGRFPSWNSHQYAGAPNIWPAFSPFWVLRSVFPSPLAIAWVALLAALVSGAGAYLFCRRALSIAFWPATIAAWAFPLTAFFVLWQGFLVALPVVWLPWLLLAVHRAVHQRGWGARVGLVIATCLTLVSGQLDVAAEVLLVSGFFGLWCIFDRYRKAWFSQRGLLTAATLVAAWLLGFLLAAPAILPLLEYSRTGARLERRSAGGEERPPVGASALPQVVLPRIYGSLAPGSVSIAPRGQGNTLESSAAAYTGLIATLFIAPLAWCSRRHRSINVFWMVSGFVGLSWCLNIPGIVDLFRLPGLRMLSYNRFTFVSSFAILCMAAIGLDIVWQGRVGWRTWFWGPIGLLSALCVWCASRVISPPESVEMALARIREVGRAQEVQHWFSRAYALAALLCALALAGWLLLRMGKHWPWLVFLVGLSWVAELIEFGRSRDFQSDPQLYYPHIPVLEELARDTPVRVIGSGCLPAALATINGLRDVRGYDGVFPANFLKLLSIAAQPQDGPEYLRAQFMRPKIRVTNAGALLSPVLDMLAVRHVIFRGSPPLGIHPTLASQDYWVLTNPNALPRAFIPGRVESVADSHERLKRLASEDFNPRDVAYVESPIDLPNPARGSVAILKELPSRITLAIAMETPGMIVLSDLWDAGWHAYLNDKPVPILRANHAVRGVVVPAGSATMQFRYEPASFVWGLRFAGLAVVALLAWLVVLRRLVARQPDGSASESPG